MIEWDNIYNLALLLSYYIVISNASGVPDRKLVHDDIFAKADNVIIRWTNSGTNTGPLFGIPPTDKPYVATGFDLFRISNGKIKEMWQQYNFASWS